MKTKDLLSIIVTVFLLVLVAASCQNNKKSQEKETKETNASTSHNSQNAVDWEGSYFGVLPCASCPGTNTLITLNANGTYEKTVEYLESNDIPATTKGKFSWDKNGQIIIIEENAYLVGENKLFTLDANHKKVEGELAEDYILTKTELEPSLDANEGYTLETFTGSDNKNYNVIFNTNPKVPTALIETDGFNRMLSQTQAWAKGAEYSGSNTKLIIQDNNATLIIKEVKIKLKQQ